MILTRCNRKHCASGHELQLLLPSGKPVCRFRKCAHRFIGGFTLVEVLIAIGITALVFFTVGSSLVHILRAEQTAAQLRESGLILQSAATLDQLGRKIDDNNEIWWEPGWVASFEAREHEFGDPPTNLTWRLLSVAPRERPSLHVEAAFLMDDEEDAP